VEYENLISERYSALMEAINDFRVNGSNLDFFSYFWWQLQKRFQSVIGTDKVVEIDTDNGKKIISYREFLRVKKSLQKEGWRVISLLTSLEEVVNEISNKNNEL